jgi:hypothetical protein
MSHFPNPHPRRKLQQRTGAQRRREPAKRVVSGSAKLALAAAALTTSRVRADAFFADQVVSYTPGAAPSGYQDSTAALGKPVADTGFGILTPFNAAWQGSHILAVGAGGSVTLHLPKTAAFAGNSLGIHAGVGIIDEDWPNGQAGNPAAVYTNPRMAHLAVSQDGMTWVDLGATLFSNPTNFYAEGVTTPGYQTTAGTTEVDWSKPFTGTVASFNGENWTQMLGTLAGSAGGTWLTMSVASLAGINFVRFTVPPSATDPMYVDAVVGNTDNVSITGNYTFHTAGQIPEASTGTIITNTGTFVIDADVPVPSASPVAGSSFSNLSIVRKSAGAGTATFTVPLYSQGGSFDVQSGTLALSARLVTGAGSVTTKTGTGVLAINGPQFHGAGASFVASGGTTSFATDAAGLSLTAAAAVNFATSQNLQKLDVTSTGAVSLAASHSHVLYTNSLSIAAAGKLDLNDNDLLVSYGTDASPFTTLRDAVFSGYSSSPDPSKTGIISSTGQTAGNTILALIDNALVGASEWPVGSGHSIDANSVIGKYTFFGDIDLDGAVTPGDYGILDANFGTTPPPGIAWLAGDADLDGAVTPGDYGILDANFGASFAAPATAAVPEPAVFGTISLGLCLLRRRVRGK